MRSTPLDPSRRWPFWLLIAAWVCANSPQVATYAVLTWLAEARHFSHQQQLTSDVAHLLGGETASPRPDVIASAPDEARSPIVPVPAASVLKRIDLSSETRSETARPAWLALPFPRASHTYGATMRAAPPHGPPRSAA